VNTAETKALNVIRINLSNSALYCGIVKRLPN
jgi:hypothetical protein